MSDEIVTSGTVPDTATSGGQLNATTKGKQRAPKGAPVGPGPEVGDNGEFKPATYETGNGNFRTDR
jgi:hypothetical protein